MTGWPVRRIRCPWRSIDRPARLAVTAPGSSGGSGTAPAHAGVASGRWRRPHRPGRAPPPPPESDRRESRNWMPPARHGPGSSTASRPWSCRPRCPFERSFDVDRAPFPQVLAAVLGLAIPDRHVDEEGLFLRARHRGPIHLRVVAMRSSVTAVPLGVRRNSGSNVSEPIKNTLFKSAIVSTSPSNPRQHPVPSPWAVAPSIEPPWRPWIS